MTIFNKVANQQTKDPVTINKFAFLIAGANTIGITIQNKPGIGLARQNFLTELGGGHIERLRMDTTKTRVMFTANLRDVSTQGTQRLRENPRTRSIHRINH